MGGMLLEPTMTQHTDWLYYLSCTESRVDLDSDNVDFCNSYEP